MGRKIPAKKHRGVKDPLEQQAKRLQILKTKINAPPKDPQDQPVPRSLTQLFAFQNKDKKSIKKRKIKKLQHENMKPKMSGLNENPIARLRKMPGETGREFSLRINSAIRVLHDPTEQTDYSDDIDVEDVKGQKMAAHRDRRARKRRKAKIEANEHLTRTQKLALKKKEKKNKALEASKERQDVQYERVAFGEVTHAPPALHFDRKRPDADQKGRRGLLLAALFEREPSAKGAAKGAAESARLQAVAAYRALKARKPTQLKT